MQYANDPGTESCSSPAGPDVRNVRGWAHRLILPFLALSCSWFVVGPVNAAQWAQVLEIEYAGYPTISDTRSVQPTLDGGYIVAGTITANAWVLRLSADGSILWQKSYGGGAANSIQVTPDGGYVVAGSYGVDGSDAAVLKLDASGNVLWQKTYVAGRANSVQVTADGGYVVAGYTNSFGAGGIDAWVLKLDAGGNILWQKTYGGNVDDVASEIQLTGDGGYIVAGHTYSFGAGASDAWVLKLDAAGNVLWEKAFGGMGYEGAYSIRPTADGGYVVAGYASSFGAGGFDAWVLRLDAGGNIIWQKVYGGALDDIASQVQLTVDGGYAVAGQLARGCTNTCIGRALLLKLDAGGNVIWQRTYGRHHFSSVQPTTDGGYVVVGTYDLGGLLDDLGAGWVLKLDANGAIAGCASVATSNASSSDSNAITRNSTASVGSANLSPFSRTPTIASTALAPVQQCYDPSPASRLTAVEYYFGGYGHYFVTAFPAEIAALDSGRFPGWMRTGLSFQVYGLDPGAASVCRFWSGQTFAPKSSHFYTPDAPECAFRKQQGIWQYEGDVFAMVLPDATGGCGDATVPLYRLYNNGQSGAPNHRYTTSLNTRSAMLAQGWLAEGSGIGVIGCVPPSPPASVTIDSPTLSPWVGELVQLTATARDASGTLIPGTSAAWSSSNPAVAPISATGVVQGAAPGSVEITATIDGVSGTQTLTVGPMPQITVAVGAKELVASYGADRCTDLDVFDSPARVVRAEDGSLVLFEGNGQGVYVSRGADFNSLRRDCSKPVLVSPAHSTPDTYENLYWIWSVYREATTWHALVNNEFHDPIASTCSPGNLNPGNPCTYWSIVYAASTDGARTFSTPAPPTHVVAPAPNAWVPPASPLQPGQFRFEGYSGSSNIVQGSDGYYYAFFSSKPNQGAPVGACVMRTSTLGDPASWRAWDGDGFNLQMTSPYLTDAPALACTLVETRDTGLPSGELVYNTYLGRYVKVGGSVHDADGNRRCGIYYELSSDLIHWGRRQLIAEAQINNSACPQNAQQPGMLEPVVVSYPSIVDHADTTINFENAGRTPYLYYVRYNKGVNDPIGILDRSVMRVPLTFTQ